MDKHMGIAVAAAALALGMIFTMTAFTSDDFRISQVDAVVKMVETGTDPVLASCMVALVEGPICEEAATKSIHGVKE